MALQPSHRMEAAGGKFAEHAETLVSQSADAAMGDVKGEAAALACEFFNAGCPIPRPVPCKAKSDS